jgi:hypothetical protein
MMSEGSWDKYQESALKYREEYERLVKIVEDQEVKNI